MGIHFVGKMKKINSVITKALAAAYRANQQAKAKIAEQGPDTWAMATDRAAAFERTGEVLVALRAIAHEIKANPGDIAALIDRVQSNLENWTPLASSCLIDRLRWEWRREGMVAAVRLLKSVKKYA